MANLTRDTTYVTPRRGFFSRFASLTALGLAGFVPGPLLAQPSAPQSDGPDWPGALKGRHRQVVNPLGVELERIEDERTAQHEFRVGDSGGRTAARGGPDRTK